MLSFKQFILEMDKYSHYGKNPKEFIAFSCGGGPENQYTKVPWSKLSTYGRGGGPPEEEIKENLNPRTNSETIHTDSKVLFDPEKNNKGLNDPRNHPKNLGINDKYSSGYVNPGFNTDQAKSLKSLHDNTVEDESYHRIIRPYTRMSSNLTQTLIGHSILNTEPPKTIKSHLLDDDSDINIEELDHLIHKHKLPNDTIVYSGLHFHPLFHYGKVAKVPNYMSTSLSPHVAKEFGEDFIDDKDGQRNFVRHILRLHLPKGHPYLSTDKGSVFPGQGEIILPRHMRYQFGHTPTHVIHGAFNNHFNDKQKEPNIYHIWNARVLPRS